MNAIELLTELQSLLACGCLRPDDELHLHIPNPDSELPIMQCPLESLWISPNGAMLVGDPDSEN